MLPMTTLKKLLILHDGRDGESRIVARRIEQAHRGPADCLDLSTIGLRDCCGCFRCWVATPGLCIHTGDEGNGLCRRALEADTVILVTRITWGGYSALVKSAADRMLPLLHPDFQRVDGAMHHRMRYARMPRLLVAGYGARSRREEETFLRYTAAHRVNFGADGGKRKDSTPLTLLWRGDSAILHSWLEAAA